MNPKKEKSREGDDGDRISHLSDDILCDILSSISTIDSIVTCVLSKRWEHLWKYVPKLHFDDSCLHPVQRVTFANTVNRALSLHTNLSQLSFKCEQISELYDITKWLSNSIARNIQSLDLHIMNYSRPRFELPSCMFSCKTLESVMLEGNILLNVPSLVCLPKLRTLELTGLEYQGDHGSLISSSTALESLVIEHTSVGGHLIIGSNTQMWSSTLRHMKLINRFWKLVMVPSSVFTFQTLEKLTLEGSVDIRVLPAAICMPNLTFLELVHVHFMENQIFSRLISSCTSLKSLNVENLMQSKLSISSCTLEVIELRLVWRSYNLSHKIVINAPALKCLKLDIIGGRIDYQIEDLASLEQAVVRIDFDRVNISHDHCSSSLMHIYRALQHVKSLKVEHKFPRGCGFGHALPIFTRLTELDICIHSRKCGLLLEFINNSTKLENLILNDVCGLSWRNPNTIPACLLTSVRSVLITCFTGGDDEMLMAKFILENARILEKMEVCFQYCHEKKVSSEKLIKFYRASEKCEVSIK